MEARHSWVVPAYWIAVAILALSLLHTSDLLLALPTAVFVGMAGLLTHARIKRRRSGRRA